MVGKNRNKAFFYAFLIIVFVLGVMILWPMRDMLLLAWVVTTLFRPVYEFMVKKLKFPKLLATLLSVLAVIFTVMIPIYIFINLSIAQFQVFYKDINAFLQGGSSVYDVVVSSFAKINAMLARIPYIEYRISIDNVQQLIKQNITPIANLLLSSSVNFGLSFARSFPYIIVFMYLLWFGFPEYDRLVLFVKQLSPLPESLDNLYLERVTAMVRGIVKGTFVIALAQGAFATISLWIAGVPYIFFWFVTLVILSLVPLGNAIITVPAAIIMFMMGNYWQAIFIIVVQVFFTSTIDNILRPYLVPKEVEIHPALLLLGFIGGIQVFGAWGFLYGPLIMVMVMTTFEVYQKYYRAE